MRKSLLRRFANVISRKKVALGFINVVVARILNFQIGYFLNYIFHL